MAAIKEMCLLLLVATTFLSLELPQSALGSENGLSVSSTAKPTSATADLPGTTEYQINLTPSRYDQNCNNTSASNNTDSTESERYYPFNNITDNAEFWRQVASAYYEYCRDSCRVRGQDNHVSFRNPQCIPCYCDDACSIYGDCCPDLYAAAGHGPSEDSISDRVRCSPVSFGLESEVERRMVTRCPRDAAVPQDVIEKCETDNHHHWEYSQPVTDVNTFLTYKNRFCAKCNLANNVSKWEISVVFRNSTSVSKFHGKLSRDEIYRAAIEDDGVLVLFRPTNDVEEHIRDCLLNHVATSECNVTGHWMRYSEVVEKACHAFAAYSFFLNNLYRNPFCALCSCQYSWSYLLYFSDDDYNEPILQAEPPLMLLLDFDDDDAKKKAHDPSCDEGQFYDMHTDLCREMECPKGKKLVLQEDQAICRSEPKMTNLYGYHICLQATAETLKESDGQQNSQIEADEQNVLGPTLPPAGPFTGLLGATLSRELFAHWRNFSFSLDFGDTVLLPLYAEMLKFWPNSSDSTNLRSVYLLTLKVFSENAFDRDVVDKSLLENMTTILEAAGEVINSVHKSTNYTNSLTVNFSATCSPQVFADVIQAEYSSATPHYEYPFVDAGSVRGRYFWAEYLPVTALLSCPAVELNASEFVYENERGQLYMISSEHQISFSDFYLTESNTALVCVDKYVKQTGTGESNHVLVKVARACMVVSLVFLFVSFIIYCLLPELRSIAGINNMVLIVALFWAQIFLQVAADVQLVGWVCEAVGCASHWLWLCVVLAQNTCTFHMFYTLSFPLRSHAANTNVRHMATRYITYVLTTASLFVAAVVVWQALAEGHSGYGGDNCFIRHAVVRIAMFAAPLGLTVLLNLAMFITTIVCLHRRAQISSTKSNRINLLLYTKLSVFTGIIWLFGFLASFTGSVALGYVFAILQGCQGIFVFLAFLANKRVFSMLKELISGKKKAFTASREHLHHHTHETNTHSHHTHQHTNITTLTASSENHSLTLNRMKRLDGKCTSLNLSALSAQSCSALNPNHSPTHSTQSNGHNLFSPDSPSTQLTGGRCQAPSSQFGERQCEDNYVSTHLTHLNERHYDKHDDDPCGFSSLQNISKTSVKPRSLDSDSTISPPQGNSKQHPAPATQNVMPSKVERLPTPHYLPDVSDHPSPPYDTNAQSGNTGDISGVTLSWRL